MFPRGFYYVTSVCFLKKKKRNVNNMVLSCHSSCSVLFTLLHKNSICDEQLLLFSETRIGNTPNTALHLEQDGGHTETEN